MGCALPRDVCIFPPGIFLKKWGGMFIYLWVWTFAYWNRPMQGIVELREMFLFYRVAGIELRLSALAASAFIYWALSPSLPPGLLSRGWCLQSSDWPVYNPAYKLINDFWLPRKPHYMLPSRLRWPSVCYSSHSAFGAHTSAFTTLPLRNPPCYKGKLLSQREILQLQPDGPIIFENIFWSKSPAK